MPRLFLWLSFSLVATGLWIPLAIAQCSPETGTKETLEKCAALQQMEVSLRSMLEELQTQLDKTGQNKLNQATMAWQNLRKQECALESDFFRSTPAQSLKYIECEIRLMQNQSQAVSEQVQLHRCTDNLCEK